MPDVVTAGSGPMLLCLHGIGSSSRSFASQLDGLADIATVVAWDAPGYRGSPAWEQPLGMDGYADEAVSVLDDLGVAGADVLGMSFGGVIAMRMAMRHPARVHSLVLADSTPGSGSDPAKATAMRCRSDELARDGAEVFARARAARLVSAGASPELIATVAATMAEAISLPGYAHAASAMADTDHTESFAGVNVPTLVLVGGNDRVTPPVISRDIADRLPDARYAEVPDAGHVSNVENPTDFNMLVRIFLDEVHGRVTARPTTGGSAQMSTP